MPFQKSVLRFLALTAGARLADIRSKAVGALIRIKIVAPES